MSNARRSRNGLGHDPSNGLESAVSRCTRTKTKIVHVTRRRLRISWLSTSSEASPLPAARRAWRNSRTRFARKPDAPRARLAGNHHRCEPHAYVAGLITSNTAWPRRFPHRRLGRVRLAKHPAQVVANAKGRGLGPITTLAQRLLRGARAVQPEGSPCS